jgi:hypothetical protein
MNYDITVFKRGSNMVSCPLVGGEFEDPERLKRLIYHTTLLLLLFLKDLSRFREEKIGFFSCEGILCHHQSTGDVSLISTSTNFLRTEPRRESDGGVQRGRRQTDWKRRQRMQRGRRERRQRGRRERRQRRVWKGGRIEAESCRRSCKRNHGSVQSVFVVSKILTEYMSHAIEARTPICSMLSTKLVTAVLSICKGVICAERLDNGCRCPELGMASCLSRCGWAGIRFSWVIYQGGLEKL